MDATATHHVSCGALVRAGRVLLVHRTPAKDWYPDVWDFPGGHVDPGETGAEALVRELWEEVNVSIPEPDASPLTIRRPGLILELWRVDSWDGDVINAAPEEHDALGWFTAMEAAGLVLADPDYLNLIAQMT
jgi:8-oxo-dGTP diphosphatase